MGFNAESEENGDLIEAGVIDPTKVERIAIKNASSVAERLLTTEAIIPDKPEDDKGGAAPPPYPPGGGMY